PGRQLTNHTVAVDVKGREYSLEEARRQSRGPYDQAMTTVKDVEDLRHPDAEQLLHTPDPARLAYNGPDGFPRVIPIGFLWNGTDIVVCTAVTAPKVKALRERPNVAI